MSTLPPESSSRSPLRWRRALLALVGAVVLFQVLINALLITGGLAQLLNRVIPDTEMGWTQAWSFAPGRIHLRGFYLARQEPRGADWRLDIERAWVNVSLSALATQSFKTISLDAENVTTRIHTVTPKEGAPAPPPPKPKPDKDAWSILIKDARVHGVPVFLWNGVRLTGITEVAGNLDLQPGRHILMEDARVKFGPGELSVDDSVVAHVETGELGATLEVERKEPEGLDIITGLTGGRLQLAATVPSANAFRRLIPKLSELEMRGGAGRVEMDVHIQEGRVAAGTWIKGSGEPLTMPVGPLALRAPWRFASDIYTREDGEERFGLTLTLGPARLEGKTGPALETPEVAVLMSTLPPKLGSALPDVHLQMQVARSKPVEMKTFNPWIGPSFQVDSGQLRLEAKSRASPKKGQGEAHVNLSTEGFRAHWGGAHLWGRVLLDVDAYKLAFQRGTMVLNGSELRLEQVSVRTGKDNERNWDGLLSFPEATLAMNPPAFKGRFAGSFSNAVPFVALLTHQGVLPHFLAPLLEAKDLEVSGTLSLREAGVRVDSMRVRAKGIDVRGWVESIGGSPSAVMLVRFGLLAVGVELGTESSVHLVDAGRWFTRKTGEPAE